ncbi:MAG: succinylglutamate desuccinylase/aspartoacylase family protein, partial [Leeuwenhoekiella sp.]
MKNIIILAILIFTQNNFAQTSFKFEGKEVAAGTKVHFKIPVEHEGVSTFIPITIFNGAKAGETLGITAGIHGYEYPPILGAQRLIQSIDPKKLKGTVILVQLANVKSFLGRSPFVNPADGKNLNCSFPGKEEGSLSEKIAYFISNSVINRVDYFLDMHAGDAPEDLMSYGAYYRNDDMPEISATGKEMALALGFDHVVIFDTDEKEYMKAEKPSLYTS